MAEDENEGILGEGEGENPTTPENGNEDGGSEGDTPEVEPEPNDPVDDKIEKSRELLSELDSSNIVLAKLEQLKFEDENFVRDLTFVSKGLVAINLPQEDKAEIFDLIQTYYLSKVEDIKNEFEQL